VELVVAVHDHADVALFVVEARQHEVQLQLELPALHPRQARKRQVLEARRALHQIVEDHRRRLAHG
jgi:hypothetical protein